MGKTIKQLKEEQKILAEQMKALVDLENEVFLSFTGKLQDSMSSILKELSDEAGEGKFTFQCEGYDISVKPTIVRASEEGDASTYKLRADHGDFKSVWGKSGQAILEFLKMENGGGSAVSALEKAGWKLFKVE